MRAERLSEGGLGFGTRSGCDQTRDVWVQRESRFEDAQREACEWPERTFKSTFYSN